MRFILEKEQTKKWLRNAMLFLAPLGILYLVYVQGGIQADGFDWQDFYPTREVIGGIFLYVINVVLDYLRKLK